MQRLVGKSRSEGCILLDTNQFTSQEIPVLHGRHQTYHFTCLPFGLASAPWVFTKTVVALGREMGIGMIIYIDDILLMVESMEKARDQASGLVYLQQCLGFIINKEKTLLEPTLILDLLGFLQSTL